MKAWRVSVSKVRRQEFTTLIFLFLLDFADLSYSFGSEKSPSSADVLGWVFFFFESENEMIVVSLAPNNSSNNNQQSLQ